MKLIVLLGLLWAGVPGMSCAMQRDVQKELLPIVVFYGTEQYDSKRFSGLEKVLRERASQDSRLKKYLTRDPDQNPLAVHYLPIGNGSPKAELGPIDGVMKLMRDSINKKQLTNKKIILFAVQQSGLLARFLAQEDFKNNNQFIDTLITHDAPHGGSYEIPKDIPLVRELMNNSVVAQYTHDGKLEDAASYIFYHCPWTKWLLGQSFADYWRDPGDLDGYRKAALAALKDNLAHLALFNNEVKHNKSKPYQEALKAINHIHLIGFKGTGTTLPRQSAIFGCYKPNAYDKNKGDTVIPWDFKQTDQYENSPKRLGLAPLYGKSLTCDVFEGRWSPDHPEATKKTVEYILQAQKEWLSGTGE